MSTETLQVDALVKNSPHRVYLVTYSQIDHHKFATRQSFGGAVVQAFGAQNVDYFLAAKEPHATPGQYHYHVAIKLNKTMRWASARKYLNDEFGVNVNFFTKHLLQNLSCRTLSLQTMSEQKKEDAQTKKMPKIVLGTMEFGRRLNEKDSQEIMASFLKPNEKSNKCSELDTAFMYQGGKTETIMGKVNKTILSPNNALIASKAMPKAKDGLTDKGIRNQLQVSLSRLQCKSIDIYYLHWPDHNTKIEESLKTMNDLYKEGKFKRFGLSNYSSWQVKQ